MKYIVRDRVEDKDDGKLIYVDEDENKEYEENISDIKKRVKSDFYTSCRSTF